MMLTLALDTATEIGSVAVGDGHLVLAEMSFGGRRHAAALLPAVHDVLDVVGATLDDLTTVVVADGPGSFTGLRIGWATVQGLVRARDSIRVATAPSLLGAAWVGSQFSSGPVAALYDALRGEVYGAVYQLDADRLEVVLQPTLGTVADLVEQSPVRPVLAVGDGAGVNRSAIEAWTGRAPLLPPVGSARAGALLALADLEGALRDIPDPTSCEPDYGRAAEAQVRWERQHGRPLPGSTGHAR